MNVNLLVLTLLTFTFSSADLITSIEDACRFDIVEPVFVLTGVVSIIFCIGGLVYIMYALSWIYGERTDRLPSVTGGEQEDTGKPGDDDEPRGGQDEAETPLVEGIPVTDMEEEEEEEDPVGRSSLAIYRRRAGLDATPSAVTKTTFVVAFKLTPDLTSIVGQTLGSNPIRTAAGVVIVGFNETRDDELDWSTPLNAGDILHIRCTADSLVKLRRQMPFVQFKTSLYKLLGTSRKLRLLYQVAVTEGYWQRLDRTEFFLEHEAVILGKIAFFLEHEAVLLGSKTRNHRIRPYTPS